MKYSSIISDMTWSYSRITTFESCPYRFLLTYIKQLPKERMFFSDYGKFMHSIIELYLKGELNKGDLVIYYLTNFRKQVIAEAPNPNIFQKYFQDGLRYLSEFEFPYMNVFSIEHKLDFMIENKNFVGVIDCVVNDDAVVILDNKSRTLSPRSRRKKPTKSDKELDSYYLLTAITKITHY